MIDEKEKIDTDLLNQLGKLISICKPDNFSSTHKVGYYNTILIKQLQKGEIVVKFTGVYADNWMGETFLKIAFPKSKFFKPTEHKYYCGIKSGKGKGYKYLSKSIKSKPLIYFYDLFKINVKNLY